MSDSGVVDEFYRGREVILTFKSQDETIVGDPLTDPSAAVFVIQPGYNPDDAITLDVLTDFEHVGDGVFQYVYDTTEVDTSNGPVEHVAQAQSTGDLVGVSDPYYFRVLPPRVPGLT